MTKRMSLKDAVARFVDDGDLIYAAGFTHLIPFAAAHEIIRQERADLTVARPTPDLWVDQLTAAGCLKKVIFSYAGNPGVGSLRVLRRAIEEGRIEWEEYSHFGLITRLSAGAAGVPFLPMMPAASQSLMDINPNLRSMADPFSGAEVMVVPALNPDVAIIHVQRADEVGNAHVWGIIGDQREAAHAAEKVILTAEEIVATELIRSDPNRTLISGLTVDAVCHVPFGAHPSYAQGYYDRDNQFYLDWDSISRSDDEVRAWLKRWVYGIEDRGQYRNRLDEQHLNRLAVEPRWSEPVNYGRHRAWVG